MSTGQLCHLSREGDSLSKRNWLFNFGSPDYELVQVSRTIQSLLRCTGRSQYWLPCRSPCRWDSRSGPCVAQWSQSHPVYSQCQISGGPKARISKNPSTNHCYMYIINYIGKVSLLQELITVEPLQSTPIGQWKMSMLIQGDLIFRTLLGKEK